jgi:hypothetical protein
MYIQEVPGKTNRLLSFDMTRTPWKTLPPTILRCRGNIFTELLPSNDKGIHRQSHRRTHPTVLILLREFFTAGTGLPSRCVAMKGGIHSRTIIISVSLSLSLYSLYIYKYNKAVYDYVRVLSDYMCMLCRSHAVVIFTSLYISEKMCRYFFVGYLTTLSISTLLIYSVGYRDD